MRRSLRAWALLGLAALTLGWDDPGGRFILPLEPDWVVWADAPSVLPGQSLRARHVPTGGGLALRALDAATLTDLRARGTRGVDVEAVLSPDRLARAAQMSQNEDEQSSTVFVGPADGAGAHLGRWVLTPTPAPGEAPRVYWQLFWRTDGEFHQLIAWAPLSDGARFVTAMRAFERGLTTPGYTPPKTVLYDAGRDGCGPPVRADRAEALRLSRRFEEARGVLRESWDRRLAAETGPMPAELGLQLAELRVMGLLYRLAESCVQSEARARRDCEVEEGPAVGARNLAFQEGIVRCMDADTTVGAAARAAVAPYLGAP